MAPKPIPNGAADARPSASSLLPPVVGINFGNSYASIAVFTKEGIAECIANEDGERQIACAVSFFGEEVYIGNQATHQLVKNPENTIIGFRDLLGKKFSEISQTQRPKSAPVIQHPQIPDEPAYKVHILQPAPAPLPLPRSTHTSTFNTPAASQLPTPRSEPVPADRILTVSEVTTMFLSSLVESAEDFLGKKVRGAVISVPAGFSEIQKTALEKAAEDAGVHVLQLLEDAGAAAVTTTSDLWAVGMHPDRTQLIVDLGVSSLSLSLLSTRSGLTHVLASSHTTDVGGNQIDEKIIKFFATDFTKKTKIPLSVFPAKDVADQRAEARLQLAIEHTKRTISASSGAATCSVESLKDGYDYTGSINRMRFDLVVRPIYTAVAGAVSALLENAHIDAQFVDEIVYVGGSACLPGLDETLCTEGGFREDVQTPFARGTVVGGGIGDPTTVLARGCAVQAALLAGTPDDEAHKELKRAYEHSSSLNRAQGTSRTVGVIFPGTETAKGSDTDTDKDLGGLWVPVIYRETVLPARRAVRVDVELSEGEKKIACEVWEVSESIRVEKVTPEPDGDEEEEDEGEEPEETEIKHRVVKKEVLFGVVEAAAALGIKTKGKGKDAGKWFTSVEVQFVIEASGALSVDLKEVGEGGATASLRVDS